MEQQPHLLGSGTYIIHKTDERHQCQGNHEPGVFKSTRQEIGQSPEIENDSPATQRYACVRTAFIGLVNNIASVSYSKIKKFCHKQQNQYNQVIHYIKLSSFISKLRTGSRRGITSSPIKSKKSL